MATVKSTLNPRSRYVHGGTTYEYADRLGWWEREIFQPDSEDEEFTITPEYDKRPDLLSKDKYGTRRYFWIILQFNNIFDINEEFITGKVIRLPSPHRVLIDITNKTLGGIKVEE